MAAASSASPAAAHTSACQRRMCSRPSTRVELRPSATASRLAVSASSWRPRRISASAWNASPYITPTGIGILRASSVADAASSSAPAGGWPAPSWARARYSSARISWNRSRLSEAKPSPRSSSAMASAARPSAMRTCPREIAASAPALRSPVCSARLIAFSR
ncbi:MAG: hypothetical protein R2939_16765 [Kofleriaceae bacterium]